MRYYRGLAGVRYQLKVTNVVLRHNPERAVLSIFSMQVANKNGKDGYTQYKRFCLFLHAYKNVYVVIIEDT